MKKTYLKSSIKELENIIETYEKLSEASERLGEYILSHEIAEERIRAEALLFGLREKYRLTGN